MQSSGLASQPLPSVLLLSCNSRNVEGRGWHARLAVIDDERVTTPAQRHLDLSDDQWDLLTQLLVDLKPLQVTTTAVENLALVECTMQQLLQLA